MKLAAIDIGSNAIRLQITNTILSKGKITFKKLEFIRFPLRLGQDVFELGSIKAKKKEQFLKLMNTFKMLIDLYEVDDYMACATSAMREAENGQEIVKEVKEKYNLKIEIIDGKKEAEIINNAITPFLDRQKNYIHIDVGGGSTEINVLSDMKKLASISLKLGSVRNNSKDKERIWKKMVSWISKLKLDDITAVGTGGNINKIYELCKVSKKNYLTLNQLIEVKEKISELTIDKRMNELQLNHDRADVIIPASEIYIATMKWSGASKIIVPNVGLKDGIIKFLFDKKTVNHLQRNQ